MQNSTKSQLGDQNNEVTKQSPINTSQSINPNVNLNCVEEIKTHIQVHAKPKNVIQDMLGNQFRDPTKKQIRNNLVNASDNDPVHRRYNIPVRITRRPNNGHLSHRSRKAKQHRPPGWPEFWN